MASSIKDKAVCEHCVQLQSHSEPRQLEEPVLGLSHNLGRGPYSGHCAVCIVGLEGR